MDNIRIVSKSVGWCLAGETGPYYTIACLVVRDDGKACVVHQRFADDALLEDYAVIEHAKSHFEKV